MANALNIGIDMANGHDRTGYALHPTIQRNIETHVDALLHKEPIRPPEYRLGMIAALKLRIINYNSGHHVALEIPYDVGSLSRYHFLNGCERGHAEYRHCHSNGDFEELINTEVAHVPSTLI